MNLPTFSDLLKNNAISDDEIETAFYLLFVEVNSDTKIINPAVELLKTHRSELAKKIATAIVSQTSDDMMEEICKLFARDEDLKKLAFYIIAIWDIHPEVAKKIDVKYSLGIQVIMDESRILETYQ